MKGSFNRAQYDILMEHGNNFYPGDDTPLGNVYGSKNINQYLCAVRNLLDV